MLETQENSQEKISSALGRIDSLFSVFNITKLDNHSMVIEAQLDVELNEFVKSIKDDQLLTRIEEIMKTEEEFFLKSLFHMARKIDPILFIDISDIERSENLVLLSSSEIAKYNEIKEHLRSSRPIPEFQMIYSNKEETSVVVNFKIGANKMGPLTLTADPDIKLLDLLNALFYTI